MKLIHCFFILCLSSLSFAGSDFLAEKTIEALGYRAALKSLPNELTKQISSTNNSMVASSVFSQYEPQMEIICAEESEMFLTELKGYLKSHFTDRQIELYIETVAGPTGSKILEGTELTNSENEMLKEAAQANLAEKFAPFASFRAAQFKLMSDRVLTRYFKVIEGPLASMGYKASLESLGEGDYFIHVQ